MPLGVAAGLNKPQGDGEHVQVTPAFCGSFVTVAVIERFCPTWRVWGILGETVTTMADDGVTVTVTEADRVLSVTEVAVTVTVRFAVTLLGAV